MTKVTQYTIVSCTSAKEFVEHVNARIKEGWRPAEPVIVTPWGSLICYAQKLLKLEKV